MPKSWTVYVINASHMDPGWHDLPVRIMAMQAEFVDRAVELAESTADLPPGQRYVFTIEHSFIVDYYQRRRSPRQVQRLVACVKRGQIEIGAIYAGVHTDLCGHEELARLMLHSARLRREFGLPMDYALLNDVSEGYTMGLAQVLARSGIKGICIGPGVKAVHRGIAPQVPRVFWWTGQDGSRVLFAWTPGLWTYSSITEAAFRGRQSLAEFDALGDAYPYDAIFRHGGQGDNTMPGPAILETMRGHREAVPQADVRLARVADFFQHLERTADPKKIPSLRGDNPHSWADGTLALAHETGIHRRNQSALITAEKLWALWSIMDAADPYPAEEIREAYNLLHLYSDHTWGLNVKTEDDTVAKSIDVADWSANWDAKRAYATRPQSIAAELTENAARRLSAAVAGPKPSLVVWNTTSWARSEPVEFRWLHQRPPLDFALIDSRTGREVPWQYVPPPGPPHEEPSCLTTFIARDVPPLGCAVYTIALRKPAESPEVVPAPGTRIENEFYRVEVDPARGVVTSFWDKRLHKELVDTAAEHGFNQYIHAHVDDCYAGVADDKDKAGAVLGPGRRYSPRVVSVVHTDGPVAQSLSVDLRLDEGPAPTQARSRYTLYAGLPWLEVINEIYKEPSARKEQVFFAFPFRVEDKPVAHVELPYAVMRWDRDILPGCWRGYSSVAHWLDLSTANYGVTFSPLEAPVVCLGGITANQWDPQWHKTYVPTNGHVYSYVMSNVWNCNYPLWQGGYMRFAYRMAGHAGACDRVAAARLGWGHAAPMVATHVAERPWVKGPAAAPPRVALDGEGVMLSALKRADDGNGWVVRLYETAGRDGARCALSLPADMNAVCRANLVEEDAGPMAVSGGKVELTLAPHEFVTLRIQRRP